MSEQSLFEFTQEHFSGVVVHPVEQNSADGCSHLYIRQLVHQQVDHCEEPIIHFIMTHSALGDHSEMRELYAFLWNHLKKRVVLTVWDLVGHGRSGGEQAYVESYETYQQDLLAVLKQAGGFLKDKKKVYFMLGPELGACIMLSTLIQREREVEIKLSGMVVANPLIAFSDQFMTPLYKKLKLLTGFKPFEKIRITLPLSPQQLWGQETLVEQNQFGFMRQGFMTLGMLRELERCGQSIRSLAYYINTPTLFLFSKRDRVINQEVGKLFAKAMDSKLVSLREYSTHHDLLAGKCREHIFRDIVDWLSNILREYE